MYAKWFVDEAKALYPNCDGLHKAIENGSSIVGRYLDDNAPSGLSCNEVLSAVSLESLQQKAMVVKRKQDLYHAFVSGRCYESDEACRKALGCPRIYAQGANDEEALDAFFCAGVGFIPDCPKFMTGECWKRFDELGLKMK